MAERVKRLTRQGSDKKEQNLSKMEVGIDIYSPIFEKFIVQLNGRIKECLPKIYSDEFEHGEITAKIKLSMPEREKPKEVYDEDGEQTTVMEAYKSPNIEHKISLQFKQKSEVDGEVILREHEIKEVDGEYIAVPIQKPQVSMDEYLEGRKK